MRPSTQPVYASSVFGATRIFAVPASHAQAMTPGPCPILDLVLGPLHLDLLGLIVDLNQVHLQITAAPNEGPLGSLLCSLSPPPTTAVTT